MRRIVLLLALVAVLVGVVRLTLEPERTVSSTTGEAIEGSPARTTAKPAVMTTAQSPRFTEGIPSVIDISKVSIARLERRPGETEERFEMRKQWVDRFERFAERASLTLTERERSLRILGDAQQQAVLNLALRSEAAKDELPPEYSPDLLEMDQDIEAQVLGSLREFLTPDQVIEFRRRASLGSFLTYGILLPLDIEE